MLLNAQVETYLTVDYHEIDRVVKAATGHTYEVIADMEWGNNGKHAVKVTGADLDDYDRAKWEKFKSTGRSRFALRIILDALCAEKQIPDGTYLISVSW